MGRVGPSVAQVKINHQPQSQGVGTTCLDQYVIGIIPPFGRIDPHTQPDGVHATFIPEKPHALGGHSVAVAESHSFTLHLREPAHIGPLGESSPLGSRCRLGLPRLSCVQAGIINASCIDSKIFNILFVMICKVLIDFGQCVGAFAQINDEGIALARGPARGIAIVLFTPPQSAAGAGAKPVVP